MKKKAAGRFAMTPSGRMHLGNIFSALLAWLSVRAEDGEMVFRTEDLDTVRCTDEYAQLVKEDLLWLGLDWDVEVPRQSERTEAYEAALELLEKKGLVFPCWCTRGELNAASAPHASDGHMIYPGTCRNLTAEERAAKRGPGSRRLIVPDETVTFTDGLYGEQSENLKTDCGDFVIRKADGVFAYQLAVVVDDIYAGITQVVRGSDLLSSTARQIYLYRLLGAEPPEFTHIPLLMAPDGRRLSKREKDLGLDSLRAGNTPEQIVGLLAHAAGLIPRRESVSARELIGEFDWKRVREENIFIDING
ncbi:MAG: tRNA glutamyl-Q(34) synthetase GluQRS [Oscillospiraceae bacterium]|nr:tRNA glutamyl-Q(34) synthetase GluQRS [Oscillospiraceae bacterium]